MSKTVIKIENLSKIYRLGEVGTGTLSHDLNRWVKMNLLGKEDPYAKVGGVNDRTQKAEKGELVAALRDINLEVKQGEVLGIIGKNGAGKSTLLKLLSRVTSPTTGSIKVKGRMASLLEVGTGFHPEMTGRENIYMNGTIMGMRKWEIDKKLDEIVEFAGVAKYLDTPTKRYSSGMTVRLGFAIAAHLEPEILVVDEVLAVGDAEFQKKAIGKMQDVSTNDGRTVLFVSHNLGSMKALCNRGLLLENGVSKYNGNIDEVINEYIDKRKYSDVLEHLRGNRMIQIKNIYYNDSRNEKVMKIGGFLNIKLVLESKTTVLVPQAEIFVIIYNREDEPVCSFFSKDINAEFDISESSELSFSFKLNIQPGSYFISCGILDEKRQFIDWVKDSVPITISNIFSSDSKIFDGRLGMFYFDQNNATVGKKNN